jgi:hypothetical protein
MSRGIKMSTDEFIANAVAKHGDIFDYSKVEYINMRNKVIITKKYKEDDINIKVGKTFGELYDITLRKEKDLNTLGYKVISIWESDF